MTPAAMAALHAAAMQVPRAWSAAEIAALVATPGAVVATVPQGFALGRVVLDEGELLTLAVHPDHRRRGAGTACLLAFHRAAGAAGAAAVHLEVDDTNAAARRLYAAAGYVQTGRRPAYYTRPGAAATDALILSCRL
jgi:ribosomal-protein-alanine N-acetyltransferase